MRKSGASTLVAFFAAFIAGASGGYALNEQVHSRQATKLKQEIALLRDDARQNSEVAVPDDEEASAAITGSGRSIRISECKTRQAVPGVTCTGMITTTSGSFAGTTQPGVLSFAQINGRWVQVQ